MKAIFKGYENSDEFNTHPDFENLKQADLEFWEDTLMPTVVRIKRSK